LICTVRAGGGRTEVVDEDGKVRPLGGDEAEVVPPCRPDCERGDDSELLGDREELPAIVGAQPAVILRRHVMGEALRARGLECAAQAIGGAGCMVVRHPHAVDVDPCGQAVGMALRRREHVVVVVLVAEAVAARPRTDARADHGGMVDPVGIHLVQEALDAAAGERIGH
jgi:hypothetical protein